MEEFVADISAVDLSSKISVDHPLDEQECLRLRRSTNARICVGRAGTGYKTGHYLRYLADHAAAMDAVWKEVDESILDGLDFEPCKTVAASKEEYLKRPDKGRIFSPETMDRLKAHCQKNVDVQIIAADGLSAYAIEHNLKDIYPVIRDGISLLGYSIGTPIFVKFGRVGVMDQISELLAARVTILLVGERPGLSTNESMSCYMAYESSVSKPESQRTVISNIYRGGMPPVEAGAQIVHLTETMMLLKKSGSELKL